MEPSDALLEFNEWRIRTRNTWESMRVERAEPRPKSLVVKFAGIDDRDAASALTGRDIGIERARWPAPDADEYYWVDLLGAEVVTHEGTTLGNVESFIETGAHDVMVVRASEGVETLIPFVLDDVVTRVTLAPQRINVRWPSDATDSVDAEADGDTDRS